MHYHAEIIMPPTDDVEAAIDKVLAPFSENADSDIRCGSGFYDWYEIGGRWSGAKLQAVVGQEKIDAFIAELTNRKVTVSGLQCGKQELSPESQIPAVDELWRVMCPGGGDVCPLFQHSGRSMNMDVCALSNLPDGLTAERFILACPNYNDELHAKTMFSKCIWNGCNYETTIWSGGIRDALAMYEEHISHYGEEARARMTPKPDWLVITVDYHS